MRRKRQRGTLTPFTGVRSFLGKWSVFVDCNNTSIGYRVYLDGFSFTIKNLVLICS